MNRKIALKAQNLHKTFYHPIKASIIRGIDLTVHQGEAVAITGRSGEGKSTLLQLLGALETPCRGVLEIAEQPVTRLNKSKIRNKHIGFIFQFFHLLEDYTALENTLMPACIARRDISKGSEAYQRGQELLEHVGLTERAHFNAKLLSGGEKQRVAIARAFCNDPDIIFADEPSGNLDKETAAQIHTLLLDVARRGNKSIVIVTHDPDLAGLCHSNYILQNGLLI